MEVSDEFDFVESKLAAALPLAERLSDLLSGAVECRGAIALRRQQLHAVSQSIARLAATLEPTGPINLRLVR